MPPEFWLKAITWVGVSLNLIGAGVVFWEIRKARRAGKTIPPVYLPFSFFSISGFLFALNFLMDHSPVWLALLLFALALMCIAVAIRGFWLLPENH